MKKVFRFFFPPFVFMPFLLLIAVGSSNALAFDKAVETAQAAHIICNWIQQGKASAILFEAKEGSKSPKASMRVRVAGAKEDIVLSKEQGEGLQRLIQARNGRSHPDPLSCTKEVLPYLAQAAIESHIAIPAIETEPPPMPVQSGAAVPVDRNSDKGVTKNANYTVVQTFFATDRNVTGSKKPDAVFGTQRAALSYGVCEVSIPRDHRMGELESPSIWRLEFQKKPSKHVTLLTTSISAKDAFFSNLANQIKKSAKDSAFIFIHGYNVTFEDAARRSAQMAYDLNFDGVPIFYSWPSQGRESRYTVDEQNIEWTQANLRRFLEDFFARSQAQNVYLIAHSMGNRALTRAVASLLNDQPSVRSRLKEIILTAPDIDADVFKRDIAPALTAAKRPITLYASSKDKALMASKKVHGNPRAGDSGSSLIIVPGIETIDATGTDTSFLGHSYFAETRSVLSDLFYLIRNEQRADNRFGLHRIDSQQGRYWKFVR